MKKLVFALCLGFLLASPAAQAKDSQYRVADEMLSYNFAAPVVAGTPSTTENPVGSIVYDSVNDKFLGLCEIRTKAPDQIGSIPPGHFGSMAPG